MGSTSQVHVFTPLLRRVAAIALFAITTPLQAAGTLDPTFANGATRLHSLRGLQLATTPDGRIALSGSGVSGSLGAVKWGHVGVFDAAGLPLTSFGNGGRAVLDDPDERSASLDAIAFDRMGRIVAGGLVVTTSMHAKVRWLLSDGERSLSFDAQGDDGADDTPLGSTLALVIDAQDRVVVGGSEAHTGGTAFYPSRPAMEPYLPVVARIGANGVLDPTFGLNGSVVLPVTAPAAYSISSVKAMAVDPGKGIVVAYGNFDELVLVRLRDDGSTDPSFGSAGRTTLSGPVAVAGDAQGRMLVITRRPGILPGDVYSLYRFVDGRLDPMFGGGAGVNLARAYSTVTAAGDGTVFVGASVALDNDRRGIRVLRFLADGTIDRRWGTDGEAAIDVEGAIHAPTLAVDERGRLVVAALLYQTNDPYLADTTTYIYRFTADTAEPPATSTAVEFRHAAFDHYFVTADADEITKLDAGAFAGWSRTGSAFTVATRAAGALSPVCRFFSGGTFAPKSSHFYTPYPAECDTVAAGGGWSFEKLAFFLRLPDDAGNGNGTCPQELRPLYRAYNAMQGGAPNHRYTTSSATLDAMLAAGWVFEGEANTRVFACVPQ